MKNLKVLLFVALLTLSLSCSEDENSPKSNYAISIGIDCDEQVSKENTYCVTQEEHERIDSIHNGGLGDLSNITFTDLNGKTHSGCVRAMLFSIDGADCN